MAGTCAYAPLPGADHLRILVLIPDAKFEEPLRCDFEVEHRDATGEYAALSYSWGMNDDGDASLCRTAEISGTVFNITRNFFEALRRIRSATAATRLWVDAVCINQGDIGEKNLQVARMAEVYAKAAKTIVWLGEGDSESDDFATLKFLRFLTHEMKFLPSEGQREEAEERQLLKDYLPSFLWPDIKASEQYLWTRKDGQVVNLATLLTWAYERALDEEEVVSHRYDGKVREDLMEICRLLNSLLGRRYFSRRWICQEIFHSSWPDLEARWGSCVFPLFLLLRRSVHYVLQSGIGAMKASQVSQNPRDLSLLERTWQGAQRFSMILAVKEMMNDSRPLMKALFFLPNQQCSDPRDMLFALTSIDPGFGLQPNYGLNTAEAYTLFANKLVEKGLLYLILHNLEASVADLASISPALPVDRSNDLPSWVPDLRLVFRDEHATYPQVDAAVERHNVLICPVREIGVLRHASNATHKTPGESRQMAVVRSGAAGSGVTEERGWHVPLAAGDMVCEVCELEKAGPPPFTLLLRPHAQMEHHYTLMSVGGSVARLDPAKHAISVRIV